MAKESRLDDTIALRSAGPKASTSVSVRPVDNGFMLCESNSNPNGPYDYKERFCEERPEITVREQAPRASGDNSLKSTMSYLNAKR